MSNDLCSLPEHLSPFQIPIRAQRDNESHKESGPLIEKTFGIVNEVQMPKSSLWEVP